MKRRREESDRAASDLLAHLGLEVPAMKRGEEGGEGDWRTLSILQKHCTFWARRIMVLAPCYAVLASMSSRYRRYDQKVTMLPSQVQ